MNGILKPKRRRGLSWWMKANLPTEWVGFDCETYRGAVKLLAASSGGFIEEPTTEEAIAFLYTYLPSISHAGTFYNLRFDASAILRDAALSDPAGVRSGDFEVGRYRVHHVPGKALVIGLKDGGALSIVRIYDSAQFFPGGLDKAAKAVLGIGKNAGELGIDRQRIGNEEGYYLSHRADIIRYCVRDAELARDLMIRFQTDVGETVGVYPAAWYSGASIAKSLLTEIWTNPAYEWPIECIADSVAAFSGGLFDTRILGRVENACEYDINSAYPWVISKLPLLGAPVAVTSRNLSAALGFYLVEVPYDGLLPYRLEDRKSIIYPTSSQPLKAWLYDVELPAYPQARIIRGWEFPPANPKAPEYPFASSIRRLYDLRQTLKVDCDPREGAVKIAMNSLSGAFAETKHGWTRFTNLVYAGRVTAACRNYLRNLLYLTDVEPVSMATDSVTFAGPVDIPASSELGGLKQSFSGATIVTYANGIRIINGRVAKVRGLPRKILRDYGSAKTERWLEASDFLNAKGDTLSLRGTGPLPLLRGIVTERQKEIASWVETPKVVSLGSNMIRGVPDGPLTFEYLKSHSVRLGRRVVASDPTFKVLTPPQVAALENHQYPGPFRADELEEEEE